MAATVDIQVKIPLGRTKVLYCGHITMDSTYPAGGEVIDATGATGFVGPTKFESVLLGQNGGYVGEFIQSSQKLKVYRDNATATAAALPEVASTGLDLSAVVFPFWGIGSV